MPRKNNKRSSNKGRRRQRSEIGQDAEERMRRFDHENDKQLYDKLIQENENLPSLEELEKHWKLDPDCPDQKRLLCNLDGGKWKIVVPMSEMYSTCVEEIKKRKWDTFKEFKVFMMDKYYVDEAILDCLVDDPREADKNDDTDANGGGKAEDVASTKCGQEEENTQVANEAACQGADTASQQLMGLELGDST